MVEASLDFVAAGGNRNPAAADWDSETGVLAYASDGNIALWSPQRQSRQGLHALHKAHDATVNAVKYINVDQHKKLIVSGSADGAICALNLDHNSKPQRIVDAHKKAVNALATIECYSTARAEDNDEPLLVSASADGTLAFWQYIDRQIKDVRRLTLKPNFIPLTLALARLPGGFVLAVAGTRNFIQIYTAEDSLDFTLTATLSGHEGWIRSLSFVQEKGEGSDILLSSASQDKYIRLWRMHKGKKLPSQNQSASDPLLGSLTKSLSNKAYMLSIRDTDYSITFEALLLGHEDWIFTAKWHKAGDRIRLLSASADSSISIWEADQTSGVWVATVRLGELSQTKGATTATGSAGGFWIGLWSPDGKAVVSLGRTGSWRYWKHQEPGDLWSQDVGISGHIRAAQDVAWSRDGNYLLSTSLDQTTRVWAEWFQETSKTWHEVSRAQIHGYDLNCVSSINPTQIITGADEKLLRVFDQPKTVASLLNGIAGRDAAASSELPDVAAIPVLGLSNKALGQDIEDDAEPEEDTPDTPHPSNVLGDSPSAPPAEDQLSRHLLWPETEKLYGHGYEISCVAASHDGKLVATACKASSLDHAVIRLYDTAQWREAKPVLTAHSLTVTKLCFSPDDKYLLSVGRDRQCAIFERLADEGVEYKLLTSNPKAHTRMVLDCTWASRDIQGVFFTAGRDKAIHIWKLEGPNLERKASILTASAVSAVDALDRLANGTILLAFGLENGAVHLRSVATDSLEVTELRNLDAGTDKAASLYPSKAVTNLQWRPSVHPGTEKNLGKLDLAISSEDSSVRVLSIQLT